MGEQTYFTRAPLSLLSKQIWQLDNRAEHVFDFFDVLNVSSSNIQVIGKEKHKFFFFITIKDASASYENLSFINHIIKGKKNLSSPHIGVKSER